MISIKENKKPNLEIAECVCDKPLRKKLNRYELTSFLNCHSLNCFLGKPRSGKTTLLYSFFNHAHLLKSVYHNIYLFQPSHSRASMTNDIFADLPDNKKFDELTSDNLGQVLSEIKSEVSEHPKYCSCIIFDDMAAHLQKDRAIITLLKEACMNRRHYHISLFFIVQTWKSMPFEIRRMMENLFIFRSSKETIETIFEELLEQYNKKDLIKHITKLVYDQPHNYLFVNVYNQRLFKNFDEILIAEE
jgi:hypothetical protein